MNAKTKKKIKKMITSLVLAGIGLMMMLPILWMLSSSFKYESEIFKVPMQWIPTKTHFGNYRFAIEKFPYMTWYLNTAKITGVIVMMNLVFSSLSGYAFAKLKFRGKEIIFFIFIATLMIPIQVRIIPQFVIFSKLDLINKHSAVYLPWMFNGFAIFLMRQFFFTVPNEMIEASKIDGCSTFRTFFQVALPLAKPSLIALTILSFTWGWNTYLPALVYINQTQKQVLAVGISIFKDQYNSNYGPQMAGATLALIPVIIVYLLAQKHFIEGIAMSGIKG
ncbi:carbohydrate ABC transporter permease [Vallitalea pronyensis]|uniref:Carbohydrate ABC transporter permease n=1 Tax=Vallitalea pronyensis TaxID=1348613 RepID=A0A8J8MN26_9FIRM|nr:carbohydrate ABC transporter permease [Vallitalea pronyensis]QUI24457.1 carbohydrate ABC transporter permease [Vallitalea pronyensis]